MHEFNLKCIRMHEFNSQDMYVSSGVSVIGFRTHEFGLQLPSLLPYLSVLSCMKKKQSWHSSKLVVVLCFKFAVTTC
jgi:hypothetical protein